MISYDVTLDTLILILLISIRHNEFMSSTLKETQSPRDPPSGHVRNHYWCAQGHACTVRNIYCFFYNTFFVLSGGRAGRKDEENRSQECQ
jgi:hypothetical protein